MGRELALTGLAQAGNGLRRIGLGGMASVPPDVAIAKQRVGGLKAVVAALALSTTQAILERVPSHQRPLAPKMPRASNPCKSCEGRLSQ